ncbi:MAG TPA: MFS transporter, partial [Acidimicrobiales bacterium]|nr:MFS transporter [Acidimicrobiales bacterium]
VIAPLSVVIAHRFGTKVVVVSGMALIALGLGLLSRTTVAGTYRDCIAAFLVLGVGVALALAPSTESVMGSLPKEEAGVGSATNDTAMQLGGALGVGVLGTALILRYQHLVSPVVAHAGVPASVQGLIKSSLGAALAVSQHAPAPLGSELALLARRSFVSGMDLAMMIAAAVVAVAAVLVLVLLPNQGTAVATADRPEAIL